MKSNYLTFYSRFLNLILISSIHRVNFDRGLDVKWIRLGLLLSARFQFEEIGKKGLCWTNLKKSGRYFLHRDDLSLDE